MIVYGDLFFVNLMAIKYSIAFFSENLNKNTLLMTHRISIQHKKCILVLSTKGSMVGILDSPIPIY